MAVIKSDEFLHLYGLGQSINGDNVTGFMAPKSGYLKEGFADRAKTLTHFLTKEDYRGGDHEKYLGVIELMATSGLVTKNTMADMLKTNAVLELDDEDQAVTYDLAIPSKSSEYFTVVQDSDFQSEFIGVGGAPFYVYFDKPPTAGDIMKYDVNSSFQVHVSREKGGVVPQGDKWKVYLIYNSQSAQKDFPRQPLRAGTQWIKLGRPQAEYDQQWSTINGFNAEPGYISMEWHLGSQQGVTAAWTKSGGNKMTYGAGKIARETLDRWEQQMDKIGGYDRRGLFVTGRLDSNNNLSLSRVSNTLEVLALAEAYRMESFMNMFATAETIHTANGVIRITEGAWFQARRGKIITYPRPGALGLSQLQEAASYYFKNSDTPLDERRITFIGGEMAVMNGERLLDTYSINRLGELPGILTGTMGYLNEGGRKLITGDLNNLTVGMPKIRTAQLPGIGWVTFKHDPSFDFKGFTSNNTVIDGFVGLGGFNKTSYSLMIEGMDNPSTVNVTARTRNAKLVEGGNKKANLYYVKPKFGHIIWGHEQGRMNDGLQVSNIKSALKYMGQEFWVSIHSGMLMLDTTANVIIEVDNTYAR